MVVRMALSAPYPTASLALSATCDKPPDGDREQRRAYNVKPCGAARFTNLVEPSTRGWRWLLATERLAVAGPRAWMVWLRTILGAVAANLVLRAAALAVFDIPPEFEPLAVAGPTVFLTVVGVGAGLGVVLVVDKRSESPVPLFRRIVLVALLLSFVPDLWMLTDGGSAAFPGATVPAVATLMAQHVAAAAVVLWSVTNPIARTPA